MIDTNSPDSLLDNVCQYINPKEESINLIQEHLNENMKIELSEKDLNTYINNFVNNPF